MENKNYIIGVDLGSTRVVGAVGRMEPHSQVLVLDKVVANNTTGMYQGNIDSTEEIKEVVRTVIQELSKSIQCPIQDIYLSHSNPNVGESFLQSCLPEGVTIKELLVSNRILANGIGKKESLEQGIGIINMGAEYTQVAIYADGELRATKSFACGGQWFSADLANVCKEEHVSPHLAELIKKQVGLILDRTQENRNLSFPVQGQKEPQRINKLKLTDILQARLAEWMEAVQYINAKVNPHGQPAQGWILTGGGCLLKNLEVYLSQEWKCPIKKIGPVVQQSSGNVMPQGDPTYTTIVNILMEGGKKGPNNTSKPDRRDKGPLKKISPGIQDLWKDNAEYL